MVPWKELRMSLMLALILTSVGVWRWLATGNLFLVINFSYIGLAILIGDVVRTRARGERRHWGRKVTQLMVGLYMLGVLGVLGHENMQVEGFFFYLYGGVLGGATLHYLVAKLVGPLHFGRGFCGWGCWTAMVLDFLPWRRPSGRTPRRAGPLRLLHLVGVGSVVALLFFGLGFRPSRTAELAWLAVGNAVYYLVAVVLAAVFRDNRAFCKILCPVPMTQKPAASLAIMKQEIDTERCVGCGLCESTCPMEVPLLHFAARGERVLSTECILCHTCNDVCPTEAVRITSRVDAPSSLWTWARCPAVLSRGEIGSARP